MNHLTLLKVLWDAGCEDLCGKVVAKHLGVSLEAAHFLLVQLLD